MTLHQSIASLFSYVNTYLVRDILADHAPAHLLRTTYGWPKDGELQLCFLCWCFEDVSDSSSVSLWISKCESLLQNDFFVLSSVYDSAIVIFIQSKTILPDDALSAILHTYALFLSSKIPKGSLVLSPLFSDYHTLSKNFPTLLEKGISSQSGILLPAVSSAFLGSEDRLHLRQKFVQKLREHQTSLLIQFLKRKCSAPSHYWEILSIFFAAVFYYDPSADLPALVQIAQSDNPFDRFLLWLEQYYHSHADRPDQTKASNAVHTAIQIMNQRFSEDLAQNDVAAEIGLAPAYLSHLFKKERGKSFVQELSEIRIRHALALLGAGQCTVGQIAALCGYNSKKYFLESFKKVTGLTLTQYVEQVKIRDES